MSMLAEPRKKQKYSLNPRGLDWANDDNKFGQKLMERMGWKKGNGLGRNEDGNQNLIAVSAKNDSKGVGFTRQHSDNWLAHQDDFAAVLSQLNSEHSAAATSDDISVSVEESANKAVMSLEQRSKSSRRRVHYKKFTQGKDLSNCQSEDLKCIFGKKSKNNSSAITPITSDIVQKQPEYQHDKISDAASIKENSFGVKTITSGTSISDYFAKKMASLKRPSSAPSCLDKCYNNVDESEDSDSSAPAVTQSHDNMSNDENMAYDNKKIRFSVGSDAEGEVAEKRSKLEKKQELGVDQDSCGNVCDEIKKKGKKRKRTIDQSSEESEAVDKKKKKQSDQEVLVEDPVDISREKESSKNKKKKKRKSDKGDNELCKVNEVILSRDDDKDDVITVNEENDEKMLHAEKSDQIIEKEKHKKSKKKKRVKDE